MFFYFCCEVSNFLHSLATYHLHYWVKIGCHLDATFILTMNFGKRRMINFNHSFTVEFRKLQWRLELYLTSAFKSVAILNV